MIVYFVTLLDIICISTQIPSIYITVKAVRHLDSLLIGLILPSSGCDLKHKQNAKLLKVGLMIWLTLEYKSFIWISVEQEIYEITRRILESYSDLTRALLNTWQ